MFAAFLRVREAGLSITATDGQEVLSHRLEPGGLGVPGGAELRLHGMRRLCE